MPDVVTPSVNQYGPTSEQVQPPPGGGREHPGGELPFSGLDVGLLALCAAVLLGTGFGLKRLQRPRDHS